MIAGRLRPLQPPRASWRCLPQPHSLSRGRPLASWQRWSTTAATGDDKSGHIAPQPGEGILFLDNVFPLRLASLLNWRPWRSAADYDMTAKDVSGLLKRFENEPAPPSVSSMFDSVAMVRRAIPAELPLTVTEIVPRLKDGGVFLKFRHPGTQSVDEIEEALATALLKKPVRPWFNPFWGCMRAGLVRGVPWLEDLASRVPSSRMRVEFSPLSSAAGTPADLSQEALFSLFRRYGKIAEITSQPSDSKVLPRYATLGFLRVRDAVLARSCLHGFVVDGTTRLRLSYEPRVRAHHIWDWLTSHPRIVLPLLAALLAAVTVAIFDPIRSFFIRAHVQRAFAVRDSQLYKWLQRNTTAVLAFARSYGGPASQSAASMTSSALALGDGASGMQALLSHRRDLLESLQKWLMETSDTFIVVQGPRGSGKRELVVDQALQQERGRRGREREVLVIDCKPIVEARGESATIKKLAGAVGYWPVFSWANNISSLVDLAVQGTTGVKAGFSETLDEQLSKILQTAAVALRQVALDGHGHAHKKGRTRAQPATSTATSTATAGASGDCAITAVDPSSLSSSTPSSSSAPPPLATPQRLEDSDHMTEEAYLEAHPERRPVVVLDNFGQRNEDATGLVYDRLAEWAAMLVQANIAHVVFLTTDAAAPKALVKALPDRVFRQIALGDLSPDVAKNYVLSHMEPEPDEEETEATEAAEAEAKVLEKTRAAKDTRGPAKLGRVASISSFFRSRSGTPSVRASATDTSMTRDAVIRELDESIDVLGGRLTDLESLVRRLQSGQPPKQAVSEIVEQSASDIIKMFLLPKSAAASSSSASASSSASSSSSSPSSSSSSSSSSARRGWTPEQAWYLVREMAGRSDGTLRYNQVLLADVFADSSDPGSSVAALDALATTDLITLQSAHGRPFSVRAGSPVYQAAFARLCQDTALAARLDRAELVAKAAIETRAVAKAEQELALLAGLPSSRQMADRVAYLLGKLQTAQGRIAVYDKEMARLKTIMAE